MLGHARPIFLRFERAARWSRRRAAAFLGVAPLVGGVAAVVWLVAFLATRYASVASMVAAVSLPVAAPLLGYPWPVIAFAAVAAGAVVLLHRANIVRLLRGQGEPLLAQEARRTCTRYATPGRANPLRFTARPSGAIVRPNSLSFSQEVGGLTMAAPDDGAAGVVDPVGELQSLVEVDSGNGRRECERHAVERVVVVVQDDHVPRLAEVRAVRVAG